METASQTLGTIGEELAYQFLSGQGCKILLKNYECMLGEIDLVAKEAGALVFIEVKTRSSCDYGNPAEAVTFAKRQQIVKIAKFYLKRYGIRDVACRFDVVSVVIPRIGDTEVRVIRNAFSEGE